MIERIVTAIDDEVDRQLAAGNEGCDRPAMARAILTAMREPTEAMIITGYESIDFLDTPNTCAEAAERAATIWRAMVGEAGR